MALKNLQNEAHKIRMTPAEKAMLRSQLFEVPSATATSTASPYYFFSMQFAGRAFAGVLALLVVLGGGGTAFAAESALPGDLLYSMKVNVNEPLKTALAVGAEARADVHLELAERRVEEAETLAAAGKLDASTTEQLEANFESHAQDADELALEVGHQDPSAAVEIQTKLSSSLSVHGAILAALGDDSTDAGSKTNSNGFATRVLARANVGADTSTSRVTLAVASKKFSPTAATPAPTAPQNQNSEPMATTFAVTAAQTSTLSADTATTATTVANAAPAPTTSAEQNKNEANAKKEASKKDTAALRTAQQTQKRASSTLADARGTYMSLRGSMSSNARADVDTQLASADKFMHDGAAALSAGNSVDANAKFTAALKLAVKLQAVLAAQKKFKKDFTPLLNNSDVQIDLHSNAGTSSDPTETGMHTSGNSNSGSTQQGQTKNNSEQEDGASTTDQKQESVQGGGIIQSILKAL